MSDESTCLPQGSLCFGYAFLVLPSSSFVRMCVLYLLLANFEPKIGGSIALLSFPALCGFMGLSSFLSLFSIERDVFFAGTGFCAGDLRFVMSLP